MKKFLLTASAVSAVLSMGAAAQAAQIVLNPSSVIGSSGSYSSTFEADNIFDQQSGTVIDGAQGDQLYWLNPDNGPLDAYITVDLGDVYSLHRFTLFNTHNSQYADRGTGAFSIVGSNSTSGSGSGTTLGGTIFTLASGSLASETYDPLTPQVFAASGPAVRYIQFRPTSVNAGNNGIYATPCCGPNVYGLTELRVNAAVPEPATWAMMIIGFGAAGSMIRRRKALLA